MSLAIAIVLGVVLGLALAAAPVVALELGYRRERREWRDRVLAEFDAEFGTGPRHG